MSELAYNINGEAFEVPAHATGWRVRRMRAKGAPEVVYGREGAPLVLPIDADIDGLRSEVDANGRYRLDLVDQHNKAVQDVPSGYAAGHLAGHDGAHRRGTGSAHARGGRTRPGDREGAEPRGDARVVRRARRADRARVRRAHPRAPPRRRRQTAKASGGAS